MQYQRSNSVVAAPTSDHPLKTVPDLRFLWVLIGIAWSLLILALATDQGHLFHLHSDILHPGNLHSDILQNILEQSDHDARSAHHLWVSFLARIFLFFAAWQVMTIAMMFPSTLPFAHLFIKVSQTQSKWVLFAFLGAYLSVWTGFAGFVFIGGLGLQSLMQQWHWISQHSNVLTGSTIMLAGLFQFSPLKEQCLTACRHPYSFLTHHYQRGVKAAWQLGIRHGLYCLGCCWALMMVMFAVGVSHLIAMLVLTGIMTLERTWKHGRSIVPIVGIALIALGGWIATYSRIYPMIMAGHHS